MPPIVFVKTHKTGSSTLASIFYRYAARHAATTELCAQLKRVEQKLVDPGDSRWVGYARSTLQCDAQLYAVFVQLERLVRAKRLALRTTPTA